VGLKGLTAVAYVTGRIIDAVMKLLYRYGDTAAAAAAAAVSILTSNTGA